MRNDLTYSYGRERRKDQRRRRMEVLSYFLVSVLAVAAVGTAGYALIR